MSRLLCERDVLVMTGWPSRRFLDARMRKDRFPKPVTSYRGVGDQWREADIAAWLGTAQPGGVSGEQRLLARIAAL